MRRLQFVTSLVTGETTVMSDVPVHDDDAPMTPERARAMMKAAIDDCPLCMEERARTGRPPEEILSWAAGVDERADPDRAVNWWHGRRTKKRGRR